MSYRFQSTARLSSALPAAMQQAAGDSYSVSCRFSLETMPSSEVCLFQIANGSTVYVSVVIDTLGNIKFIYGNTGSSAGTVAVRGTFINREWHTLQCVRSYVSGNNYTVSIFLDGIRIAAETETIIAATPSGDIYIGNNYDQTQACDNMWLADVSYYPKALYYFECYRSYSGEHATLSSGSTPHFFCRMNSDGHADGRQPGRRRRCHADSNG